MHLRSLARVRVLGEARGVAEASRAEYVAATKDGPSKILGLQYAGAIHALDGVLSDIDRLAREAP